MVIRHWKMLRFRHFVSVYERAVFTSFSFVNEMSVSCTLFLTRKPLGDHAFFTNSHDVFLLQIQRQRETRIHNWLMGIKKDTKQGGVYRVRSVLGNSSASIDCIWYSISSSTFWVEPSLH